MVRKFSVFILLAITSLLVYGTIFYLFYEDSKICNELVIMNDESQIEAKEVNTFENGMSHVYQCNGEEVHIPTINIKMVKKIKSPN